MSAAVETAIVVLGAGNLAWPALIAAGKIQTARPRRTGRVAWTLHQILDGPAKTPAGPAADTAPARPAAPPRAAVARSDRNPQLAAYAAARPRNGNGQFTRLNGTRP